MSELPERVDHRQLRASDADREQVAEVLRTSASEGRLDLDELDERLRAVYASRTYADLEPLLADLPAHSSAKVNLDGVQPPRPGDVAERSGAVAVMSGFHRRGAWIPPRLFTCLAFWGGGTIDLRDARFLYGDLKIRAFAVMGGVDVIVPDDAAVEVTGMGVMGGFDHGAATAGRHGAPRIVVTGFAFWGGVTVRRKDRKDRKHKD
ncbi:DUF1707 domain-containing protein [Dactylosporangium sp. NPDC049742]|uniref:DUF1707 SHOCT-like domain-containing protein n=1 Tax=Dactylosporangium sp. NPDC049742 TaxID=3154737 RepID=UPI00341B23E1